MGEAAEPERKSSIGQPGGGYDERDEGSTTATALRAGWMGSAFLVAISPTDRGKRLASVAKASPPQ
jgi:hypothetical protein